MNIDQMLSALTPEIIEKFRRAVELGKWQDGNTLNSKQKDTCLQAIIAWEASHLPEEERTGFIPPKATSCDTEQAETPVKWK